MDEKKRSVCLRLAYEVPYACVFGFFFVAAIAPRDGALPPYVSYSPADIGITTMIIAFVASVALLVAARPKFRQLLLYPLVLLFMFALLFPLMAQAKLAA